MNKYIEELKRAIDMEIKGQRFYGEFKDKTKNALGKKLFSMLADDEQSHIEAIKNFAENISTGTEPQEIEKILNRKPKKGKEGIFGRPLKEIKEQIGVDADDLRAYGIAMQMEKDGYNFYKKCRDGAEDKRLVRLFQFLIEEESLHYQYLDESYEYLAHPSDWFTKEEKPIFEG